MGGHYFFIRFRSRIHLPSVGQFFNRFRTLMGLVARQSDPAAPVGTSGVAGGAAISGSSWIVFKSASVFPSARAVSMDGTFLTFAAMLAAIVSRLAVFMELLNDAAVVPFKGVMLTSAMTEPALRTIST